MKIGVISDTHGLVRPEALAALAGSDLILHAGDVGTPAVLHSLGTVAPVLAVRGNCDFGPWADELPEQRIVEAGEVRILVLHDLKSAKPEQVAAVHAVVSGHSHVPAAREDHGVAFLNPGSAGPRRFRLPVAVARMRVSGVRVETEIVLLG